MVIPLDWGAWHGERGESHYQVTARPGDRHSALHVCTSMVIPVLSTIQSSCTPRRAQRHRGNDRLMLRPR